MKMNHQEKTNNEEHIVSNMKYEKKSTNRCREDERKMRRREGEDDEISNVDTDLNSSDSTQVLDTDLMTANDEEKIVDQVKQLESKAISEERLERIKKATDKLRSPLGLNEMESEPAYKRRNVDLKDVTHSDDSSSSRYTLWENINDSGEKETGLSDNNCFLHDNVD